MPINQGPLSQYTPQLVAQIAQGAFHPAPLMPSSQAPGAMNMPQPQPTPGFNLQAGLDSLSRGIAGLANWKPNAQSNGMSVLSPEATGAAYSALPANYTRPGLEPAGPDPTTSPAAPSAAPAMPSSGLQMAEVQPVEMPDFLSNAPGGILSTDTVPLQGFDLPPGMAFA